MSAAERVFDVMDMKSEQERERGALALPRITRSVEFQEVTFHYDGHGVPAIADIDFDDSSG